MPVYKQREDFLRAALHSVLTQTRKSFKLVIVIDGAPEMENLIKEIIQQDRRVEIISYPINKGVPHALNTGFEILYKDRNIQYLTWVSTDNIYYPRFLDVLRNALVKGPAELGLVYSGFQSIDNDNNPLHDELELAARCQYQGRSKDKLLDSSIIGVSFMYKSIYAKQIEGYGLPPVEDYDYWLRITELCEIKFIPVELMDYRVNSSFSVSASLLTEVEHRKWRYTYHLARHLARCRRGILPQISILFPYLTYHAQALDRLENLYEQTFSNYFLYVLNRSYNQQESAPLVSIPHPVTDFKWLPHVNETTALLCISQMLQTPYTLILGPDMFPDVNDLQILVEQLTKAGPELISNYYTSDRLIGYRSSASPLPATMMYNELFRTSDLVKFLKEMSH
ncbi:glycosyltransferase family 2 protein [Paenibacillus sp. CMAA1364]